MTNCCVLNVSVLLLFMRSGVNAQKQEFGVSHTCSSASGFDWYLVADRDDTWNGAAN